MFVRSASGYATSARALSVASQPSASASTTHPRTVCQKQVEYPRLGSWRTSTASSRPSIQEASKYVASTWIPVPLSSHSSAGPQNRRSSSVRVAGPTPSMARRRASTGTSARV